MPAPELVEELRVKDFERDNVDFRMGTGCPECIGTGYRGRTAIFEMLAVGPEMRKFLLQNPSAREIRAVMAQKPTFVPMRLAGFLKAVQGVTTLEEVLRVAPTPDADMSADQHLGMDELCRRAGVSLR